MSAKYTSKQTCKSIQDPQKNCVSVICLGTHKAWLWLFKQTTTYCHSTWKCTWVMWFTSQRKNIGLWPHLPWFCILSHANWRPQVICKKWILYDIFPWKYEVLLLSFQIHHVHDCNNQITLKSKSYQRISRKPIIEKKK